MEAPVKIDDEPFNKNTKVKIIVPMAGRGSRLRPHTLTVPKPLLPVAGTPIVEQLVAEIAKVVDTPIDEVAFILGDPAFFDEAIEEKLIAFAHSLGAEGTIYRQLEPLGTGHAIMTAAKSLQGPAVVAYADTLIRADLSIDPTADAMIWVKKVENPEAYGVVKLNENDEIVELVEKPKEWVSDLAVIGIYYFKDISQLRDKLEKVVAKQLMPGMEYQINDGIKALMEEGSKIVPGQVSKWMDCGNPQITLQTNTAMLQLLEMEDTPLISAEATFDNAKIIEPCYIGPGAIIKDSTVGPHVSVGAGTTITNCHLEDCLIQNQSTLLNAKLKGAMIGNQVHFDGNFTRINIGDYSTLS